MYVIPYRTMQGKNDRKRIFDLATFTKQRYLFPVHTNIYFIFILFFNSLMST